MDKSLNYVTVGHENQVWGVDSNDNIFFRVGSNKENPAGSQWMPISGKLKQISAGKAGVWGVNSDNEVYYRTGTYSDPNSAGEDWEYVGGGKFKQVASGSSVLGVKDDNTLYLRIGGSWKKLKDSRLAVVDLWDRNSIWGVDNIDRVYNGWARQME